MSQKHEMLLTNILEVELFDVWGIDLMGPFPPFFEKLYILITVDYVFKWVEATTLPMNDAKAVVKFLSTNIFSRFGSPRAIINDKGTHFLIGYLLQQWLSMEFNTRLLQHITHNPMVK